MDDFNFNNVHPLCANQRAYRRKGAHIVSYSASLKKHLQKISIPQVLLEFGIKVTNWWPKDQTSEINGALSLVRVQSSKKNK